MTTTKKDHHWVTCADRLRELLELVAEEQRPCRACGTPLFFVVNRKTGKRVPLTKHGVNHFIDCPKAAEFRKRESGATQGELLDTSPLPG